MSPIENLRLWPVDWDRTLPILFWLVLFSVGTSVLGLLFAFGTGRATAFLKEPEGRLPLVSWAMFWPYYLYNHILLFCWRYLTREPAYHEILPGLFLGRRLCVGERAKIMPFESLAVLDLTAEFQEPGFMREQADYLCLPVVDMTAPSPKAIQRALDFIRDNLGERPVYVHCALGHGRSAVIVLAYLLAEKKFDTFEQAYDFVRAKRWGVNLTRAQKRAVLMNR